MTPARRNLILAVALTGGVFASSKWALARETQAAKMKVETLLSNAQGGTLASLPPKIAKRRVVKALGVHAREHGPIESYRLDPVEGFGVVEVGGTLRRRGHPFRFNARCFMGMPVVHYWEWPVEKGEGNRG